MKQQREEPKCITEQFLEGRGTTFGSQLNIPTNPMLYPQAEYS